MKNSVSDHSFYIESEEEDEEKAFHNNEGEDDRHELDSSDGEYAAPPQRQPSSYNTQWPQSYRQSMDLYSSVPSPGIGILSASSVSRSSFLSRRHTPESLSSVSKPLIADQIQQQKSSSHLPPLVPSGKSSVKKDGKPSAISHEVPIARHSTYGQAVLNGINVLCGVGILSTPYAAKEGGWFGLLILLAFAVISFYTGLLLRYCLDSEPGLETYPDIGQAAFGTAGRIAVSIVLYAELYACCVNYIILESDNLSALFPNAHISVGGYLISSHRLFALMTTLAVLPTCWLRDLSILSYISAGGVIASVLVVLCLFWAGLVDNIGSHNSGTTLNLATLPVAIGLYGYCYSGHAVFPNIYSSMAKPNQFPAVLLACFGICTLLYAGVAVMGYTMFGEEAKSQFTLNMGNDLVVSKIAIWTTVVNPATYALTMSPVAMSLEELIPSNHMKSHIYAILIRTGLVISTLFVALTIPFFGLVLSLVGSLLTMLVTLILPCLCFLCILRRKVTRLQVALCVIIIMVGVVSAVIGSFKAISEIIENLRRDKSP
ncbi:hypothetical protein SLEP1_g42569 [Rubroshorea leprosula]|uniref:Amino acid transporter transmembrane domain-containing protein n=2 Tax=Rubroshorea leprosula TaxID=152421 RepID=A0AAV5LAN8_9ROSI|nr:hypothetical protein SLEP1_g42569 [Rubroshorea leprosula]